MNYYQHNIGDYRRDTLHLTLLEHGIYRQLIDSYYLAEQAIPLETEVVFRRLSAKTNEEKQAVETILSEFFIQTEIGWKHRRCETEISIYQAKAGRARDNGKLGGRPKKTKEVIFGNQEKTGSQANHKPLTNNQEPDTSTSPSDSRDPQKFQMHVNWKPSEEFPTLAKMSMVKLQDGKLGEFIVHWLTRPDQRTQAEWDKALLQSILHDKTRGQSPPRAPQREKFEEKDYGKGGKL